MKKYFLCAAASTVAFCTLAMLFTGCGMRRGVVQLPEIAYLALEGDSAGLQLQIDDRVPQEVRETRGEVLYAVEPGRRRVRVWRGDELIVNREVFLARGQNFVVVLP
jgi:hypothetical protein